ncbi:MAG TPA: LON peptidase substrate-binding domain-containing protein [Terracidiphilus sp.]|nr:LON peptidase substrate-binding domain-containing protein [Terracidiphilus sp.]
MGKLLGVSTPDRLGFAFVGLFAGGNHHLGAETILLVTIVFVLVLDFSWRKLSSHPAYGTGLLCLGTAIIFVDAWIKRGPSDGGTMLGGAAFVMTLFRLVEKVRKDRQPITEAKQGSARPVVSASTTGSSESYRFPMVPLRDMVLVPGMKTPFVVGRKSSVRALEYAIANDHKVFLATQHDAVVEDPKTSEISQFGCICRVLQSIKMTDGKFKVLIEGLEMAKSIAVDDRDGVFFATVARGPGADDLSKPV